ncbi:MAG: hypothetical protein PHT88_00685 [Candidatus Moranbacteria bacterium]|nr:hypothetical protein [Candidatus Moranbacteria bacterium]
MNTNMPVAGSRCLNSDELPIVEELYRLGLPEATILEHLWVASGMHSRMAFAQIKSKFPIQPTGEDACQKQVLRLTALMNATENWNNLRVRTILTNVLGLNQLDGFLTQLVYATSSRGDTPSMSVEAPWREFAIAYLDSMSFKGDQSRLIGHVADYVMKCCSKGSKDRMAAA